MVLDENGRSMVWVNLTDIENLVNDDVASLEFVLTLHLCFCHVTGAWDVLIEIVGMCGTDVRNVASGLCKGCSIGGVRVYNALYVGECLIEHKVCWGIGRRIEVALHYFAAFKVYNYHVLCFHLVVADTRGFDDNETFLAVDA